MVARVAGYTSFAVVAASAVLLSSCSSSTPSGPQEHIGDVRSNEVWKDGEKIAGVVLIHEGATVEIQTGSRLTCAPGAQIQVGGTFRVNGNGSRRTTIACNRWIGFLVAANGQLDITGLDISNADVGVETTKKAGSVKLEDMNITSTTRPFLIHEQSEIVATKVTVTTPVTADDVSVSEVFGKLTAKYLDYEANTNEGVMVQRGGSADIQDSSLHGKNGLDLVSSYGGDSLKVSYTTLSGAHCGVHVDQSKDNDKVPTGSITVDHVSSDNLYGITIYAASTQGPHVVKDSNLKGAHSWIDLQGNHGPITFQNVFTEGSETILCDGRQCPPTDIPTFNMAPARIPDAKPR